MRKQQQIWNDEHANEGSIPSETGDSSWKEPSSNVTKFTNAYPISEGMVAIDIGCGKGRNAIHLASLGANVFAVDYAESAISQLRDVLEKNEIDTVNPHQAALDEPWDFEDDFFDIAIDSYSSIDIETLEGRIIYRDEMLRTLKPGGLALVVVVAADDEIEAEFIAKHPGPEPNSTVWPSNGKFQKNYDENEIREFYKAYEIVELQKIQKPAHKLGRDFTSSLLWLVLRKPSQ